MVECARVPGTGTTHRTVGYIRVSNLVHVAACRPSFCIVVFIFTKYDARHVSVSGWHPRSKLWTEWSNEAMEPFSSGNSSYTLHIWSLYRLWLFHFFLLSSLCGLSSFKAVAVEKHFVHDDSLQKRCWCSFYERLLCYCQLIIIFLLEIEKCSTKLNLFCFNL